MNQTKLRNISKKECYTLFLTNRKIPSSSTQFQALSNSFFRNITGRFRFTVSTPPNLNSMFDKVRSSGSSAIMKRKVYEDGYDAVHRSIYYNMTFLPAIQVGYDAVRGENVMECNYMDISYVRSSRVDMGMRWLVVFRTWIEITQDYGRIEMPHNQNRIRSILWYVEPSQNDDTLQFFALRCGRQMILLKEGGKELIHTIDKLITSVSCNIRQSNVHLLNCVLERDMSLKVINLENMWCYLFMMPLTGRWILVNSDGSVQKSGLAGTAGHFRYCGEAEIGLLVAPSTLKDSNDCEYLSVLNILKKAEEWGILDHMHIMTDNKGVVDLFNDPCPRFKRRSHELIMIHSAVLRYRNILRFTLGWVPNQENRLANYVVKSIACNLEKTTAPEFIPPENYDKYVKQILYRRDVLKLQKKAPLGKVLKIEKKQIFYPRDIKKKR